VKPMGTAEIGDFFSRVVVVVVVGGGGGVRGARAGRDARHTPPSRVSFG